MLFKPHSPFERRPASTARAGRTSIVRAPNITSALSGGRADAAIFDSTNAIPLIRKGDTKLLGWAGDLAGYIQASLVFASRDMVDHHGDTVKKFLAAYRKATQDYHAAFTDAQGKRKDGPTAAATLDIIAQWIGQPPERVALGLGYFDRDGRVDMTETQKQIDWYRSIGAIKDALRLKRYRKFRPKRCHVFGMHGSIGRNAPLAITDFCHLHHAGAQ